jgi:hypothetical protein
MLAGTESTGLHPSSRRRNLKKLSGLLKKREMGSIGYTLISLEKNWETGVAFLEAEEETRTAEALKVIQDEAKSYQERMKKMTDA